MTAFQLCLDITILRDIEGSGNFYCCGDHGFWEALDEPSVSQLEFFLSLRLIQSAASVYG
ncbi:MAG: hypothetical protein QNI90_06215 [Dinoroseobacter sp.]|nr:hypothetical protein [Dinoroseobacter sp.]